MGAGVSNGAWRARQYRALKRVERELNAKGILCKYHKSLEVRGDNFVVYHAGAGPASNGERMAWLVLRFNPTKRPESVVKSQDDEDYTDFHTRINGDWDSGVGRVLSHLLTTKK